jgi:predicted dienelactone hydrolase
MRPFEILLSGANLLAFLSLVLPLPLSLRWMRYAAPFALLIVLLQIAVEGMRWQMVPAYGLAGLFFVLWLPAMFGPGSLHIGRFAATAGIGLGVLGLVLAIAPPLIFPVFHFPQPTGPYAIGTLTYHWADASRPELFTTDPDDHRELMVQVWYPARNEPSAPRAPYIQDAEHVTPALARLTKFPGFLFSHFKYVTTHAVSAAPVAEGETRYPVLIYFTGLDGFRSVSTFQIEELVSQGYIVVGLDQPGAVAMVRFPDGREISGWPKADIDPLIMQSVETQPQTPELYGTALPDGIIPYFAQDASFVLDQLEAVNASDPNGVLTGRLDLARAGTFGISLGGMNAAEACHHDPRLKACLIMDVYIPADVVWSGLQQPVMFITRDADTMRLERQRSGGWTEKDIALTLETMRTVYKNLPGAGYYLEIPGIFHIDFTDAPYWSPFMRQLGLTGLLERQRGFDILNAYSVAFFDRHLKGQPSPLLDETTSPYPEAVFETRKP